MICVVIRKGLKRKQEELWQGDFTFFEWKICCN